MTTLQKTGKAWLRLALLGAASVATCPAGAEEPPSSAPLQAALADWQAGLRQVSTIASDFVQEKKLALFQDPLTIRGRLFIATNGLFAWETHWPVRYKMVVTDGRIRQWDEETGRVQSFSLRDNPAATAIHEQMSAWFSGRYESLAGAYTLELAAAHPVSFLFAPREGTPPAAYIDAVQVWLRPDGRYLDRVRIAERSGDSTWIQFTNTVINATLPAATWEVQALSTNLPPAGVMEVPSGE